jgi:hypothetical protein
MRTSPPSPTEVAVYSKFTRDFDIVEAGEVGVRNADIICGPIINSESNSTITAQTLAASLLNVKNQIKFKSPTYKSADALARNLSPAEQAIYVAWAKNQKLLVSIDGSEEGYQNVLSLLGWMRGSAVTAHSLDLALGNIINNPQPGQRIHFHPQPKQQDRSVVQGKPNHAFNQPEEKKAAVAVGDNREYIGGRKNHAYTSPEDAQNKVAAQGPLDAWAEIIAIQLKNWVLPSQEARLQNEYNAGVAAGKSHSDISMSLAAIIRDRQRGR